mgnify:CR=1 FL=1
MIARKNLPIKNQSNGVSSVVMEKKISNSLLKRESKNVRNGKNAVKHVKMLERTVAKNHLHLQKKQKTLQSNKF